MSHESGILIKYCFFDGVDQTQAILFLNSMSERGESDIERLWTWKMDFWIDSKLIEDANNQIHSRSMSDSPHSDIDFKNKMACVLTVASFFVF